MSEDTIHPADELFAVREEIAILEARQSELRATIKGLDVSARSGKHFAAVVVETTRETIDKKLLIADIGEERAKKYMNATTYDVVRINKIGDFK